MDQRIKFRHLQTFLEVARQRSVGKAADALAITQPAVTRTMRELEEILGVALLEKEGRGIRVSHLGEVFLKHAAESLASVQRGMDSLAQAMKSEGPPISIGTLPTASATFMPDAVAEFLASGTGSQVKIATGENRVLLDSLRLGELDLVVGRLAAPERMAGLFFEPLYSEEVAIIVSPGHPLLARRNFTLGALANYTVLMPNKGSVIRPYVDRLLLTNGIPDLPKMLETVSASFGRAFVMRHNAVWFISRGVVVDELESGRLAELSIDMSETRGAVGLTTQAGVEPSAALALMMQTIRNHVAARTALF
ncbi:pca operon transcription factor PcaQ [Ciceribacter naphthalenivorans]|uniref:Pca operon transcription factor PcaQ n=3 Tax=Alphaproteobacteria TaxID=28211 RepID=A0A512HIT4_9HYPH|nr:pca operon transcription factor PcaQ [Sphingomonas psychrolutea]GEO85366.1 pca operon transcription factor PcaQ [Ciceribacter naphthalenivorans]GLR21005.1 pca operon transcription factor PcaQ [Ciceribacter naphthalenivorans]GLT03861.1 pca operon transcription factor PcaQ [Sphingomonas psychrolutea]